MCRATSIMMLVLICLAAPAWADVIGYWRFEGDNLTAFRTDASGAGNHITSGDLSDQYTLPASGRGEDFSDPVPQTGAANAKAYDSAAGEYLVVPDSNSLGLTDFTVEAFIRLDAYSGGNNCPIVIHWNASTGNRSWQFALDATHRLKLLLSPNGAYSQTYDVISATLTVALDTDYYVAASFDLSESGNGNGGVTFYLKDLSAWGASLLSDTQDHTLPALHRATGDMNIGNSGPHLFDGLIDELRLSNTVLGESELLIAPEPGTLCLLAAGALALLRRSRRPRP